MIESKKSKKSKIIPFHPDGEYFFQKGMACYQRGELDKANKYMTRALTFKPNDVEYLCQQAAILSELEQYESSISILKKVVYELDNHLTECYFFMANNYAYLGDFREALEEINTYLTLEPNGVFRNEAWELYRMLKADPEEEGGDESFSFSAHERGRLALEHGRFDEAVQLFQKVIRENPDFLAARNNLSIAYFSIGNSERALDEAWYVLERDPGNIHALCNLGSFYYNLGDGERLKRIKARMDCLYPLSPEQCGKLGSAYLNVGDYEKAYRWLMAAEKKGVRCDQVFWFWKALSAYHTGRLQAARRCWKRTDYFSDKPFHPFTYSKIQDMIFEAGAGSNFMAQDLLRNGIRDEDQAYQLFSLFYLAQMKKEETLAEAAEDGTNAGVKSVAARLLQEIHSGQPNARLQIMREVEWQIGGKKEALKHAELYSFWAVADAMIGSDDYADTSGWAGALLYLWKKEVGMRTSQKKVADSAGTTVYRLRKHIRELAEVLEKRWEESLLTRH
ncbi:tetratricopeptide repeat protein [Sporolactobacillus sp. THM7-7]|nr:tetratricopeptide repeat protein [Sporolactobacillus sp. THM7-7]